MSDFPTDAVTMSDLLTDEVTMSDFPTDEVTMSDFPTDAVTMSDLLTDEVTMSDFPTDAVTMSDLLTDEVTMSDLPTDAVTMLDLSTDEVTMSDLVVSDLLDFEDVNTTINGILTLNITERSTTELVISATLLSVIILLALVDNIAVIFAIWKTERLREQAQNLFIINLSITDMSSALIVMLPALFFLVLDVQDVNIVLCNIICAANYVYIIVSMLTLAFIGVERYIAINHTYKHYTLITRNSVIAVMGYSWLQGLAFGLAPVILNWVHYDYWEVVCAIDWHYNKEQAVYYVIVAFAVCFFLPGMIMLYCYLTIMRNARRVNSTPRGNANVQNQAVQCGNNSLMMKQLKRARKSASKTIRSLIVVVICFFIFMTPFSVTKLLKVCLPDVRLVPPYANLISSYFAYLSSVINPLIYAIFRPDFRSAYRLLWWKIVGTLFPLNSQPTLYSSSHGNGETVNPPRISNSIHNGHLDISNVNDDTQV